MSLIFDIETVADEVAMSPAAEAAVMRAVSKANDAGEDLQKAEAVAVERLGISPWTAFVGVFACYDTEKSSGACFAVVNAPEQEIAPGFLLKPFATEGELVHAAWKTIAARAQVVTWNGLDFDQPFLVARAMLYGVKVPRALLNAKPWEDTHVDLCAKTALGYRGAASLEVVSLALGIPSPKGELDGRDVTKAWRDGRQLDVARYCCGDVYALNEVWKRWRTSTSG